MRTFTTLNRLTPGNPSLNLSILASDASSTYTYGDIDIVSVPSLRYRGSFGGGMADPVGYKVSLGFKTIGEVKDVKDKLLQGTATLQVTVNSDQFTPHIGRVKTTKRPGADPLRLELGIVDKFFDDNPTIPKILLSDSFSAVHPANISDGYPLYYGDQSKRPYYMSLTDSIGIQYIGPRNVSSAYHTSSVFYHSKKADQEESPNFVVNEPIKYVWAQQCGSNNFATDVTSTWVFQSGNSFLENSGDTITNFIAGKGFWLCAVSSGSAPADQNRAYTIYKTENLVDWKVVRQIPDVTSSDAIGAGFSLFSFQNGSFRLAYKTGKMIATEDGDNWYDIEQTALEERYWGGDLTWTGSGYLTFSSLTGRRLYSADGNTWSRVGCSDNITRTWTNLGIAYNPGKLIVVSGVNSAGNARYFHSSDHTIPGSVAGTPGASWVEATPAQTGQQFKDITYAESPGYYISIGVTSGGVAFQIEASSDGENWINVYSEGGEPLPNGQNVTYNNGLVHIVGDRGLYMVSSSVIDSSGWLSFSGDVSSSNGLAYINFDEKGRYVANQRGMVSNSGADVYGYYINGTYPFGGPDSYYRYSVYADTNSNNTDVAISENPLAIIDHVSSLETLTPYVQSVSSASQQTLANSGYKFQCFFAEPEASQKVFNEFGQLCATNFWMGDSGMLHSNVYVESASATVDETITPKDMVSFEIEENSPTERRAEQAANYTLQWGYNFQTGNYKNITIKNPSNNAFCESMSALGVNKFFRVDTKYITDSATANYAINNFVRLMGQGSEIYRFRLGPWAMALELNDILKVQNPMIVGSESLAQITGVDYNLDTGAVSIVAEKLLEGP